jgi:putative sulfotransferase
MDAIEFAAHPLDEVSAGIEQVFVVGTGRCGSTLVSGMLRQHRSILSLSEWFSFVTDLGCAIADAFPEGLVNAAQMWAIVGAQLPRQNLMLRHDVVMPEVLYPWNAASQQAEPGAASAQTSAPRPSHRYNAETGVPAICQVALPHLSHDPDALFEQLQAVVLGLSPAPVGVQYQRIFAWLAQQQGASTWVERSGGGLRILARLRQHFPRARFVHIVRDGADTALSMSQHRGFRFVFAAFQLLEVLGLDPYVSKDRRWEDDLSDEQAALLPERFTKQAFLDFSTPPPMCGHYWSGEICNGLPLLQDLAASQLLTLRYEDILQQAASRCATMLGFILQCEVDQLNQDDKAWVAQVAAMVRKPTSSWDALPARLREQTGHACQAGMKALAAAGVVVP